VFVEQEAGGWGRRASLDFLEERKPVLLQPGLELRPSSQQTIWKDHEVNDHSLLYVLGLCVRRPMGATEI